MSLGSGGVALAILTLALSSHALPWGKKNKGPEPFDLSALEADRGAITEAFTKLERGKGLKGSKKVFIPSFQVEYIVKSSASAGAYSYSSKGSTRTASFFELSGLENERARAVTDRLYQKLVSDLEAKGFEVVPIEELEKHEAWVRLKERGAVEPSLEKSRLEPKAGESLVVAPSGMAVYYTQSDPKIGLKRALGNVGKMNKGENAQTYEGALMEVLEADMIKARFVIGFTQIKTKGGWRDSSEVSASMQFAVAPRTTEIQLIRKFKKYKAPFAKKQVYEPQVRKATKVHLTQGLFGGDPFVTAINDITPTAGKVVEGAANAMSILGAMSRMGGGTSMSKTRKYAVVIDPDAHEQSTERYVGAVIDMFMQRFESGP